MAPAITDLMKLFREELILCKVKKGDKVAVVSQADTRPGYVEGILLAVESLGAHGLSIPLPGFKHPILPYGQDIDEYFQTNDSAVKLLTEVDMVIDLTPGGLTHSKARRDILDAGAKMLTIVEPPDILERLMPTEALRRRVETSCELIRSAKRMRVTSPAGTDVTVDLPGPEMVVWDQYGYTDQPGRWDHFPGGFAAGWPVDGTSRGRIVVSVGDMVLPMNRYVDQPIEVNIEKGFITGIETKGLTGLLVKRYLESTNDPDAMATSHFGWGVNAKAVWEVFAFHDQHVRGMDARSFAGGFMWSTGPNAYIGRFTPIHLDIIMRDCTIYLDDTAVIKDGKIVAPALLS